MAEKGIKEKIRRSYERYCSYDLKVWSLAFFDDKTGGYVVVDLRRIAHSERSKNEGKKYRDELEMATVSIFFTDEEIVYDLDTATPQQLSGRGGDPSAPCGGDRSINYFS